MQEMRFQHSGVRPRDLAAAVVTAIFLFVAACQGNSVPDSSDWDIIGNGTDNFFYSSLDQINDGNVQNLGLAWSVDLPTLDGPVGNILVSDGIAYESAAESRVFAIDLKTKKLLWEFSPEIDFENAHIGTFILARMQRGVSVDGDQLFIATADCQMIALDKKSGEVNWNQHFCDMSTGLGSGTAAPRVGNGLVFQGTTCSDAFNTRGYIVALDQKTGKERWRFYGVPQFPNAPEGGQATPELEMAAKTWGKSPPQEQVACGGNWEGLTFDPVLNQLYIPTSGHVPWRPDQRAPDAGDELFAGSIVAVNADSGKYAWHYKLAPHDGWNWEASTPSVVTNLKVDGQDRRVLMNAPKHGFLITLDAKTGEFLAGDRIAKVNWASGFDAKGRPILTGEANYWEKGSEGAITYPGPGGAHLWQPMSFSPDTGLVYIPVSNGPTLMAADNATIVGGAKWDISYEDADNPQFGSLVAIDPVSHKIRWEIKHEMTLNGGVMSTAGNLVFQGTGDGKFEVRAADTGKLLWSKYLGASLQGVPSTFMFEGEQYILLPVGNATSASPGMTLAKIGSCEDCRQAPSRILAFKLGGKETLAPNPKLPQMPKPPLPRFSAALAEKGAELFLSTGCETCHGDRLINGGGKAPDLRRADEARHKLFKEIVHGGLLKLNGMPQFDYLTDAELEAIQAYIINNAWDEYEKSDK